MSLVVRPLEEVDIIRRHEPEVERAGDFHKVRIAAPLGVKPGTRVRSLSVPG